MLGERTRLKPISKKRAAERRQRAALVAQVTARGCEAAVLVPGVACGGPIDCHEVIPRSAWAKGYLELSNLRAVCRQHHSWIDEHPILAHDVGLHGFSWERE